jgi:hypothetical protein
LCPVNFERLLLRAQAQRTVKKKNVTDLTPFEVACRVIDFRRRLGYEKYFFWTPKLECLVCDWCSTKTLWHQYCLDKDALKWFFEKAEHIFATMRITPHESVGMAASQNCAEPLTQLTLNRFHKSGQKTHLVSGVARMKEIINAVKRPQTPSMSIFVDEGVDLIEFGQSLINVTSKQLVSDWVSGDLYNQKDCLKLQNFSFLKCWKRWMKHLVGKNEQSRVKYLLVYIDKKAAIEARVSPRLLCRAFRYSDFRKKMPDFDSLFSYSDLDSEFWWVCINMVETDPIWKKGLAVVQKQAFPLEANESAVFLYLFEKLIQNCNVKGIPGVEDFYVANKYVTEYQQKIPRQKKRQYICTKGSNLAKVMQLKHVQVPFLMSNHLREIENVLGIDAARTAIESEWKLVMTTNKAHVGMRHIKLISEAMCYRGFVCAMTYQGICRENSSVTKKASFEKAVDSFVWGAAQGHTDVVTGSMDAICWNGILRAGTGCVEIMSETVEVPSQLASQHLKDFSERFIRYQPPPKKYFAKYLTTISNRTMPKILPPRKVARVIQNSRKKISSILVGFVGNSKVFVPSSPKKILLRVKTVTFFRKNYQNAFVPSSPKNLYQY